MTDVYSLTTAGAVPVTLADMKSYMKVSSASDDALITSMLSAATLWGEGYTAREFRANTWTLLKDEFEDRIVLNRHPVATVTNVQHLVAAALVTVSAALYYLKRSVQYSEILLVANAAWPTNTDAREQVVSIVFVTQTYAAVDLITTAIKQHVAYWYQNRGDCASCSDAAEGSGVSMIYNQFRIERI